MIRMLSLAAMMAAVYLSGCQKPTTENPARKLELFNSGWAFRPDGQVTWEKVTLPHTMQIEPLIVNNQWQGKGYYEKRFTLKSEEVQGKKIMLEFEAVMQEATVYLNGQPITLHAGGYLPFLADLTDHFLPDKENTLRVEVANTDNPLIPPGKPLETLDFNMYGGIYRNVHLHILPEVYITHPLEQEQTGGGGIYIHFDKISQQRAEGSARVWINNTTNKEQQVQLKVEMTDRSGTVVHTALLDREVSAGTASKLDAPLVIDNPQLWSPEQPNLYTLIATLWVDGQMIDRQSERTGIRHFEVRPDGFLLNGEKRFLWGTNRHQEYPFVGYAITDNADRRDAVKIKSAGFDLVRLSHYPHSEAFLDACDELGILVMDAIPGWQWYLEDSTFQANALRDIRHMARRDRNHPSVAFWEVSLNESGMSDDFMMAANKALKEELPYTDSFTAGWLDHPAYDVFIPARQHGKAPYYWNNYKTNERALFIAEYGDWEYYAQNAGFNQKAFNDLKEEERTSRQLRGFGEKRLLQQALNYQEAANSNLKGANTFGHANWLMFDYNRGYADDLEASGISDIFRIPKFAFWFYQSQRHPEKLQLQGVASGPMVKLATWWTPESSPMVKVYSNCEQVALYLDDQLMALQEPTRDNFSDRLPHPPFVFDLGSFQPGTLRAVGYIAGQEVASDIVRSPGEATALEISVDLSSTPLSTERQDVVFVYARITDSSGTTVPINGQKIHFTVEGAAESIGGNPAETEAGIATVLLRTQYFKEKINITASTDSLFPTTFTLSPDR